MTIIKNLFWNNEQGRLRASFRILIQLIVFFILMKGLAALLDIPDEITGNMALWVYLAFAGVRLFRVLISVWLGGRFLDRRPFADFGFHFNKYWWQELGIGLVLGVFMISCVFLVELAMGWVTITDMIYTGSSSQNFTVPFLVFVFLFSCVGVSEELNSRGYHLKNIAEGFNIDKIGPNYAVMVAVVLSSMLFGLFHFGSPGVTSLSLITIVLMSILLGIAYALTGRLALPIGVHITWNLFQGNVFGFPVSGTTFPSETVTFFSISQSGPDLWTGGAFGPEGGLIGLFAVSMGILLIFAWARFKEGKISLASHLAQPPLRE